MVVHTLDVLDCKKSNTSIKEVIGFIPSTSFFFVFLIDVYIYIISVNKKIKRRLVTCPGIIKRDAQPGSLVTCGSPPGQVKFYYEIIFRKGIQIIERL